MHLGILAEMIDVTLRTVTGQGTARDAWRSLLRTDDIVGLKFNRSGQKELGTTNAVGDVLVASLRDSGWSAEQIVCIEAPVGFSDRHGTTPARTGFDVAPTDFGSGSDRFAVVLDQVTAIVNVPFLKTHNLATITCALKNLSHAFVKHPGRYHGGGCAPYIGDIVGMEKIRGKLRLTLVDALRVVADGGPSASGDGVVDSGLVLASTDPVAIDATGLGIINDLRQRIGRAPVAETVEEVAYLAAAHRRGLGIAIPSGINQVAVRV